MQRDERVFISRSPEETRRIARELLGGQSRRALLALHGELGAGKTCFVQGLAAALGIADAVTSPTFTIVNEYRGRLPLYHIDLYRLSGPDELFALGLDEYLEAEAVIAIEWAERAEELLPPDTVDVFLRNLDAPDRREITIRGR